MKRSNQNDYTPSVNYNAKKYGLVLVNYRQAPQERRDKYLLIISAGGGVELAKRARDWRWSKLSYLLPSLEALRAKSSTPADKT